MSAPSAAPPAAALARRSAGAAEAEPDAIPCARPAACSALRPAKGADPATHPGPAAGVPAGAPACAPPPGLRHSAVVGSRSVAASPAVSGRSHAAGGSLHGGEAAGIRAGAGTPAWHTLQDQVHVCSRRSLQHRARAQGSTAPKHRAACGPQQVPKLDPGGSSHSSTQATGLQTLSAKQVYMHRPTCTGTALKITSSFCVRVRCHQADLAPSPPHYCLPNARSAAPASPGPASPGPAIPGSLPSLFPACSRTARCP